MLARLYIKDIAIIEELEVEFSGGFEVLTGETGAGKSMLVKSLQLLLGGRAGAEMVRPGRERGEVEAEFDVDPGHAVLDVLGELELLGEQDGMVVLRRIVSNKGRGKALINGHVVPLSVLGRVARELFAVCGQHEHVKLADEKTHLRLLDQFAGLGDEAAQVGRLVTELKETQGLIDKELELLSSICERREYLEFSIRKIESIDPRPGELDRLEQKRQRLLNRQRYLESLAAAIDSLSEGESSAQEQLGRATSALAGIERLDAGVAEAVERLRQMEEQVAEIGRELQRRVAEAEDETDDIDEVERRLLQLRELARTHGGSIEAVLERLGRMRDELEGLEQGRERLEQLEKQRDELAARVAEAAGQLSKKRKKAAKKLCRMLADTLRGLSMPHARVEVEFERLERPGPAGADDVRLLLSTNPDQPLLALRQVASGGELSRVLLALKTVLSTGDDVDCYVFDEVDAGIGGEVASEVGRRLREIGAKQQVICITHLAPIAALAAGHYRIDKRVEKGKTVVEVRKLDAAAREREIARMLSGREAEEKALDHARELLRRAR